MKYARTALELFGFIAVTVGAFLWATYAGFIVAGVCLIILANFAGDN